MGIIKTIRIRNFKCFRKEVSVDLNQGTFLVGVNNAGKTAILEAIRCYFDSTTFVANYVNRTELTARQEGYNRSDITAVFDLNEVDGKARKKRMLSEYGKKLTVKKSFTWREATNSIAIEFQINNNLFPVENLPKDVSDLISAVSISYIHPQEGAELLAKAQDKFKQRLFHNWGRHASVATKVKKIEEEWDNLKNTADTYLSSALTTRLREIWPSAEVKVELPENIKDIIAVSDIKFRSAPSLPQISLTSHGTGAQSAILYQTHYILDSDRSLHQGQYYPIWLLEEPESFLHADITFQIANLLSSNEWLGSIQMIISTHSPIILAGSRRNSDRTSWILCDNSEIKASYKVSDVEQDTIDEIGYLMGDGNFGVYFSAAQSNKQIFLEDSRAKTAEKISELGISDPISLNGIGDVNRHLQVLTPLDGASGKCFFIVDTDDGLKEIKKWIDGGKEVASEHGWKKIDCGGDCYLVMLPEGYAIEHIFNEWNDVLQNAVEDLYDAKAKSLKDHSPMDLVRAAGVLRNRAPNDPDAGKLILASQQDVKDRFWSNSDNITIGTVHANAMCTLLEME